MTRVLSTVGFYVATALAVSFLIVGCERQPAADQAKKDAAQAKAMKDAAAQGAKEAVNQAAKKAADTAAADKAAADAVAAAKAAAKAAADRAAADKAAADKAVADAAAAAKKDADAKKAAVVAAVKPPAALAMFQTELEKGSAQINALQVSVNALLENAAGDLDPHYEAFQKELEATKEIATSIRTRKEEMTTRGASYFELWEKQLSEMKTDALKALGEKRREELAADYGAVTTAAQLTGDAYEFYMKQIKEIEEALDDDLSEQTVKGLAPKIGKAAEQAKAVQERIATAKERLAKIVGIYAGT